MLQQNRIFFFKIAGIITVIHFATPSFANESRVTAETQIAQSFHDRPSIPKASPVNQSWGNNQQILQRLQLGVFSSRAEVERVIARLNRLHFKTWIIPVTGGYAVGAGAFSSQLNLDRAVKRLRTAGLSDKIHVIEVDAKRSERTVAPARARITRSPLLSTKRTKARVEGAEDESVPKKKYEKLEREVELLKTQMQSLLEQKTTSESGPKSTSSPSSQAQAEPSETDATATSSDETADRSTADKDSRTQEDVAIAEGNREEEAADLKRQFDTFLRRQTVLFKRGEVEVEFGLNYAQDAAVSTCFNPDPGDVFCPPGALAAPKQVTRAVDTSIRVSYGIADDLALSLTLPYGYNELETDIAPFPVQEGRNQVSHTNNLGLGDISGTLRYTAWHESGNTPGITLNLSGKSSTGDINKRFGTGFWNVGGGMSLVKTIDPVVFFGSVGYTAALQDGRVDPGDQVSYAFGGGFSLNDRVSVSTALSGSMILRTKVNGREIPGSALDINSLQFSSTIKLTKALFVEPFVAFGLTKEAGDFAVGLRIPYRFGDKYPLPFFSD